MLQQYFQYNTLFSNKYTYGKKPGRDNKMLLVAVSEELKYGAFNFFMLFLLSKVYTLNIYYFYNQEHKIMLKYT